MASSKRQAGVRRVRKTAREGLGEGGESRNDLLRPDPQWQLDAQLASRRAVGAPARPLGLFELRQQPATVGVKGGARLADLPTKPTKAFGQVAPVRSRAVPHDAVLRCGVGAQGGHKILPRFVIREGVQGICPIWARSAHQSPFFVARRNSASITQPSPSWAITRGAL